MNAAIPEILPWECFRIDPRVRSWCRVEGRETKARTECEKQQFFHEEGGLPYRNQQQIRRSSKSCYAGRVLGANPFVRFGRKASYPLDGLILKKNDALVNKKFLDSPREMPGKLTVDRPASLPVALSDFVKSYTNFRLTFPSGV